MSRMSIRFLLVTLIGIGAAPRMARAQAQDPFVGEIVLVSFPFAPKGWLICEGQILPIAENVALFQLVGTTYGGDGISTFGIPDLRGRVAIGQGQGPGLTNRAMGQTGGVETVALSVSQLPPHTHTAMAASADAHLRSAGGAVWGAKQRTTLYSSANPDLAMSSSAIASTGGGQAHENMQPFLVLNYIIALQGIFPTQG
jgi:microcystin-dependent protein